MRNLQECQAEVFRRSEKRIKERKQRQKHILTACIPLVLTVGIYTGLIAPNMHRKTAEDIPPGAAEVLTEAVMDEMTSDVVEIQVEGVNVCYSYSSSVKLQSITEQLEDFSTRAPASGAFRDEVQENLKENTDQDDERSNSAGSAGLGYTIILVMEDGSKVEYYLAGNILENSTEGKHYILTQEQLKELKSLLGIMQP